MSLRLGIFHDPYLVGNGRWCSTCFPEGPPSADATETGARDGEWRWAARRGCNECAGAGRVVFTAEEIVTIAVAARSAGSAA